MAAEASAGVRPRPRALIAAMIAKDLRLFVRDRFYLAITVLSLVAFGALFWVLPADVEGTVTVGLHGPADVVDAATGPRGDGLELVGFASRDDLLSAVVGGEVAAGIALPGTLAADLAAGARPRVVVLVAEGEDDALAAPLVGLGRELARLLVGADAPVDLAAGIEVLGVDRAADPPTPREELRPLLIFVVLLVELFALAALVAVEVVQRTVTALLVTPMRAIDLIGAKLLLGTGLVLAQAVAIAAVTGALATSPGLVVLALLLGAVLVTGVALAIGSSGQDFIGLVFLSMLAFVPMAVPAFATLFPGRPALWVRVLPTHGIVAALEAAASGLAGIGDVAGELGALAAWCVVAVGVGVVALRRRVVSL